MVNYYLKLIGLGSGVMVKDGGWLEEDGTSMTALVMGDMGGVSCIDIDCSTGSLVSGG